MTRLSTRERRILTALAEASLGVPTSAIPPSLEATQLVDRVEEHLRALSADGRWTYRFFLRVLEYSAVGFFRSPFRRFSRMSLRRRQQYLATWRLSGCSPRRLMKRFLEALIAINYYGHPAVEAACGYRPTFRPAAKRPALAAERTFRAPSTPDLTLATDIVVIGSGAGGAVAAKTLTDRGREVVILEEGDLPDPADFGKASARFPRRYYRNGGATATYGWPNILVPVGRVVGGTTVVNSGTCLRVGDHIVERWETEFGLAGWAAAVRQRYPLIESILHVTPVPDALQGPHAVRFAEGARRLGLLAKPLPRNALDCQGSGVCCFGCPTNAKLSTALTFLPMATAQGARLYANARVDRLERAGRRITAVIGTFTDPVTRQPTGRFRIAAATVVVAGGALQTPVLLKRSDIPDPGGHIGRHLTLHPAAKMLAQYAEPIRAWEGVPQGMVLDALEHEGVLIESIFTPPAFVASSLLMEGAAHRAVMERYPYLSAFGFLVSDVSEGRVMMIPGVGPFVYYRLCREDLAKYRKGLIALAEIFFASGASEIYPGLFHLPKVTRAQGMDVVRRCRVRRKDLDLSAWHPLGTCRMAADPRRGAIDPTGRLFALDNCYVADGSVFPTSLGVNPQVTIMAAAMRIAEGIASGET